jgi:hypothetical protein
MLVGERSKRLNTSIVVTHAAMCRGDKIELLGFTELSFGRLLFSDVDTAFEVSGECRGVPDPVLSGSFRHYGNGPEEMFKVVKVCSSR